LALVPEAARFGHMGLRLPLRADDLLQDALCVLRDPSCESGSSPCRRDTSSNSRYGTAFDRRLRSLGIIQIRAPFRSPQSNSLAERWVKSLRTECLDHMFVLNERHLRATLAEYVQYFNRWRPHRSIGQRAPCAVEPPHRETQDREVIAKPVLGGLHHVYRLAA